MTGGLITSDPKVMMGKPVIAGTRITVELILAKKWQLEIDRADLPHPRLSQEAIRAALGFASEAFQCGCDLSNRGALASTNGDDFPLAVGKNAG